jgi:hypothetical protein
VEKQNPSRRKRLMSIRLSDEQYEAIRSACEHAASELSPRASLFFRSLNGSVAKSAGGPTT